MSDVRVCPERPDLLDGLPIGQYHCGCCGCMVLAGSQHPECGAGCWLPDYTDQEFESITDEYAAHYSPLFDSRQLPGSLPPGRAWVWMGRANPPRWAIRGLGVVYWEG